MGQEILIVASSDAPLTPLTLLLRAHGYSPRVIAADANPVMHFAEAPANLIFMSLLGVPAVALCQAFRQLAEGAVTPIFFVGTGQEAIASPAAALGAGGDSFIQMPLDAAAVLAQVTTFLGPPPAPQLTRAADAVLAKIAHQEAELARLAGAVRQRNAPADKATGPASDGDKAARAEKAAHHIAERENERQAQAAAAERAATQTEQEASAHVVAEAQASIRQKRQHSQDVRQAERAARALVGKGPKGLAGGATPAMDAAHTGDAVFTITPLAAALPAAAPEIAAPLAAVAVIPTARPLSPEAGTLRADFDMFYLMVQACAQTITGHLVLSCGPHQRTVYFEQGIPVDSRSNQPFDSIEEFLYRAGKITQAQYQAARLKQLACARHVGAYLVGAGHLKPEELFAAVRGHLEDQIYSCFEWDEATTFQYHSQSANESSRIALDGPFLALLMEGMRRKYLLPQLINKIGAPSSLVGLTEPHAPHISALGLQTPELAVMRLLDGQRNLEDVIFSGGQDPLVVYRVVHALVGVGAAKVLVRGLGGMLETADGRNSVDPIDRARIADKLEQVRFADYFQILGIPRNASTYEIERAAKDLVKEFAIDHFSPGLASEMSAQIHEIAEVLSEAHEVLGDPSKRDAYSRHLP